jgi:mannose-6-phosphate isomerase-like protein (cupin superfamily)
MTPNCIVGTFAEITKPWGFEWWLEENNDYCYKRIFIKAGFRTSLQYHKFKKETNYVISGKARVLLDEIWYEVKENDYFTIEPGIVHRVEAITDLILQETSTKHTEDVIRLEDDFNRKNGRIPEEHV